MCKRIAVYYCGGCNPRYDRVRAVRELRERFPRLTFTLPDEGTPDGWECTEVAYPLTWKTEKEMQKIILGEQA